MSAERRRTFFAGTFADAKVSLFFAPPVGVVLERGGVLSRPQFEAFCAGLVKAPGVVRDEQMFS